MHLSCEPLCVCMAQVSASSPWGPVLYLCCWVLSSVVGEDLGPTSALGTILSILTLLTWAKTLLLNQPLPVVRRSLGWGGHCSATGLSDVVPDAPQFPVAESSSHSSSCLLTTPHGQVLKLD